MQVLSPPNAGDVSKVVEDRLAARESAETVTIEWRGAQLHIPVISMPLESLHYNPGTHRIRAQRSTDPDLERELDNNPFGPPAQSYLHQLLMGDPADPRTVDPRFTALQDDLKEHGQSDPGIITRAGVLINGNTRRAALKEIGILNIRVGILPPDAGMEDLESVELSLQLRKDHRRDYSFMNFLLAIDERATAGQPATSIQAAFRIKPATYDRSCWILRLVRDAIKRSQVQATNNETLSMRLVDFEAHQGKLEELYRSFSSLRSKSPDDAEALREQRLLALILDKSKTDLRLIDADFVKTYTKIELPTSTPAASQKIPGTSITVSGPSQFVQALQQLTTSALQARSVRIDAKAVTPAEVTRASTLLAKLDDSVARGLDLAGKQVRVVKRRFAATDRVSDACDDLGLAIQAIAEARSTGNFESEDLDEILVTLRANLEKLAATVLRGSDSTAEGIAWLRAVGKLAAQFG